MPQAQPAAVEFASYQEATEFLFAMVDFEKLSSFKYSLPNFDLRRTEQLLASVGSPHLRLRTVHIAGTKGKGSTAMMARALLTGCGYKTGLFTSPHLVHLEERITIDDRMIRRDDVRRILGKLRPYVDSVRAKAPMESPTFFELVTALGFQHFAEQKVDFAVIEVGMGGRLDSTNVLHPLVCVISHLDYDHVRRLGPTLDRIAWEKAGIIKPGVPVVCAPQQQEALRVVEDVCRERSAPLHLLGRDFELSGVESRLEGAAPRCTFALRTPRRSYADLMLPLLGPHQAVNAALAIRSVELLEEAAGVNLDDVSTRKALAQVRCPARLEIIPGKPLILLDGAHNPAAMAALRATVERDLPGRRLIFVFGVARDKDVVGILRECVPLADRIVFTRSDSPRATPPAVLLEMARLVAEVEAVAMDDAAAALAQAREWARPEDVICITGSLYLAGKLRPLVVPEDYIGLPPPLPY